MKIYKFRDICNGLELELTKPDALYGSKILYVDNPAFITDMKLISKKPYIKKQLRKLTEQQIQEICENRLDTKWMGKREKNELLVLWVFCNNLAEDNKGNKHWKNCDEEFEITHYRFEHDFVAEEASRS